MEGLRSFMIIYLYCSLPGVVCFVYSPTGSTSNYLFFEVLAHNTDELLRCSFVANHPQGYTVQLNKLLIPMITHS